MNPFELLLFSAAPDVIAAACSTDIDAFVVDWENQGKYERQRGADTQINHDTVADLQRVRAATTRTVICRINGVNPTTRREVAQAIDAGADELLVPMARHPRELETVLRLVRGRCAVGMLLETREAVANAADFATLPLRRVYFGLNDYSIATGARSIFDAVADGTVARTLEVFDVSCGFGGLTLPACGTPLPCRLLMAEYARLHCGFCFLRRSFLRDADHRDLAGSVRQIRHALQMTQAQPDGLLQEQHEHLRKALAHEYVG